MTRRLFVVLPALVIGAVGFALASPALAHDSDPYCVRPYPQQSVVVNGYDDYGDSRYSRPYDGYARYDGNGAYGERTYEQRYYGNGYGSPGYGTGVIHEDHIRTSFRPFPFPHIEKRVIHHYHPAPYGY